MFQRFVWLLSAWACVAACSPGDAGPSPGDPMLPPDEDEVVDLDTYLRENDVVRLADDGDGIERGLGVSDEMGVVRFYSEQHEAMVNFDLSEHGVEMPVSNATVLVSVGETGAAYLVMDPENRYAPLLFSSVIPETDLDLMVDGWEALHAEGAVAEFDPDTDPFASEAFTIIGISISINIRTVLVGMAVSAVADALGALVEGACRFVAPTFRERCELAGQVVSLAVNIVGALYAPGGVTGWDLLEEVADAAADRYCPEIGKTLVGYVRDPNDDEMRNYYRRVAQKLNYILAKMETDPRPGQPSWARMAEHSTDLVRIGRTVRNRYFEMYNLEMTDEDDTWGGSLGDYAGDTLDILEELELERKGRVMARVIAREEVRAYLRVGNYDIRYRRTRHLIEVTRTRSWRFSGESIPGFVGPLVGCAFNIVKGAEMEWADGEMRRLHEIETKEIVKAELDYWNAALDELYAQHWGGTIPTPGCLADEYEPNGTWQSAVASPVPVTLGAPEVAEIQHLNLCDGLGSSGTDEDWYAYYVAPIEFNVQARIIENEMETERAGRDQEACVDIFFYSQIYEIGEFEPDRITGTCGAVSSWPATETFGIRRTIGEEWSMMLLRVRPGPSATGVPIDYGLRFTP